MNQSDRVVLVTGGGHGIGRAISEVFARDGARVVIADRLASAAESVANAIRKETAAEALPVEVDVRDAASVEAAVQQVIDRFDQIDVLVNNAGIYPNTPIVEMDEAEWDAVFDTNVKGMFLVSRAVARRMIDRGAGGRIVNISSGAAKSGRVGAAHYCASKAAVDMFTRVLALELASHDIVVNAVAPGLIEVPDWSLSDEYINALIDLTPMGRIGQPEDIARAVLYLASPEATFITGSVLSVDGGSLAGRPLPLSG
ncbi:MAG TPA: SDR family NAD(P)-dependent oxidoreductase [Thermomicrobiales bacterium]|nr:SDR family NAD(P)-dependent oxidoreductase [Thermomicrobiales bacterium]